ncbi:outer membrane beta-barrel protein [Dysgonomonas sp. 511]|uniref:outer membrane beta-barrel protein n=1 Tax=Dysgonomonas sp. 511 TaxID=2302930 RepID=UPI0013D08391|nr:outer membrane beta-barrel protein [Dysgonomonas sp. 511]
MKKLLLSLFVLFALACNVSAQDQAGKFSLAANINYGTKIESVGFGLRGQYGILERLRGSLEYKYYMDRRDVSAWGITADVHYLIGLSYKVALYPIGGVTFSRWTADLGRTNVEGIQIDHKYSNNRMGANLGAGCQVELSERTFVQIEAKEALIKDYSQFVVSVGFMYQF